MRTYEVFPVKSGVTAFNVPWRWFALACAVVCEFVQGQAWDFEEFSQ